MLHVLYGRFVVFVSRFMSLRIPDMCKAGPGRAGPRPADRPSLNSGRFGLKISQNLSAGPASASEICRPTGRSACRPVSEHQAPTITDRQQRKHTPRPCPQKLSPTSGLMSTSGFLRSEVGSKLLQSLFLPRFATCAYSGRYHSQEQVVFYSIM